MTEMLQRREFLKLSSLLAACPLPLRFSPPILPPADKAKGNILIILFDALSAYHIQFYGYPRPTMPNLSRIAERATVYHHHYACGNWTPPGTASLITGVSPWTHRINKIGDQMSDAQRCQNLFSCFSGHYRFAYTHNFNADFILENIIDVLDQHKPLTDLLLDQNDFFSYLFKTDFDIANLSRRQILNKQEKPFAYSVLFSEIYGRFRSEGLKNLKKKFPRGLPDAGEDSFFLLEHATTWLTSNLKRFPEPYLAYIHLLPPHFPYAARNDFVDLFEDDGYKPISKPSFIFSRRLRQETLNQKRREYDEYLAYIDDEFGRFYDALQSSGVLENTLLVLTSDHGELFERGYRGHYCESLHQPILRIPLLIFEPGQTKRRDIYSPTSAVDVLPTLLHLQGLPIPDWCEGQILPPYQQPDPQRSIVALEAKDSLQNGAISPATAAILKNGFKLIYYTGYNHIKKSGPVFELYDVENDPEELQDLYSTNKDIAAVLFQELINLFPA